MRTKDLTGQTFGRLTALHITGQDRLTNAIWHCRCVCGKSADVNRRQLVSGGTMSCGCLRTERLVAMNKTHGMTKTPLAQVWSNMMRRCYDSKNKAFKFYGAKGISVCPEWHRLEGFLSDMQASFQPGLWLDRISSKGNYEPKNCRWATVEEQQNNRSDNVILDTPLGKMTQAQAARAFGIPRSTFNRWYLAGDLPRRMGW